MRKISRETREGKEEAQEGCAARRGTGKGADADEDNEEGVRGEGER